LLVESPKGITASLHKELIVGITAANAPLVLTRNDCFLEFREYNAYALRKVYGAHCRRKGGEVGIADCVAIYTWRVSLIASDIY